MRRFLLLFAAVFLSLAAVAEEELKYQCLFGSSYNSDPVETYNTTWTSTKDGYTWTLVNFSNYKNGWEYARCGAKKTTNGIATITSQSLPAAISKVSLEFSKVRNTINSVVLESSVTGDFTDAVVVGNFTTCASATAGNKTTEDLAIATPTENLYYRLTVNYTITGNSNGALDIYSISYYADVTADPTDCGLTFKETSKTITYGTGYTLPTLSNPNNVSVKWSSSDETVASFDAENNLQIHKAGTTTITATLADEGTAYTQNTSASYELTIEKGTPVFAYTESSYSYEMKTGGEGFAAPTLNNPGNLVVTYSSDKSEVATVSADGVITPITRGTAVITATGAANDLWNGAIATLTINITKNIPTLTFSNTEVSKFVDEIADYKGETPTVTPADLVVSYSIANPEGEAEVASINETTGELTFTGATGTATVTATTTETLVYESKKATYTVTVSKRDSGLAFETAKIEKYDTESYEGQDATYTIEEGLGEGFTVTYASDNDAVATVDANTGAVTLTGAVGTAVITATASGNTYYNEATASYTITVSKQYIFADTFAVLVSDVNDLHEGDVIAIGYWSDTQSVAMTNSTSNDYFVAEKATYSDDHKELTLTNTILLLQLEKVTVGETEKWGLRTLNYDGEQGYIGGSAKGKLGVSTTVDAAHSATITIGENYLTKILFTGDFELRCNTSTSPIRFAAYAGTVQPVYIYKLVRPEFKADITIAEDETEGDANKITFSGLQESHGLAFDFTGYSVYLNGTMIGDAGKVLSYLPFVPTRNFTISNGTYTYPIAVTWPDIDFSTIKAKVTEAKYYAYCDKEHTVTGWEDSMWYLDAEYTIAPDCAVPNLYFEMTCTLINPDNESGSTVEKKDNKTVCVNRVGLFMFDETPTFETNDNGSFKVTLTFPFYVKTALKGMMLPADAEKITSFGGLETTIDVTASAGQVPQPNGAESGNISGVESVVVDSEGAVEYYNLQGVRVEGALTPGIYIRRAATGTSKVAIR